jgi:NAD(P)-dependent dehydrogenase (short-subunit alcohol dehydrogenase family)
MPTSGKFAGKHAVITGAGSGIGRAIALRLASEGAHVHIVDLNADAAEAVAKEIRTTNGEATAAAANVADESSVRAAFAALPRADILVNSAGIAHIGNVINTPSEDFDRLYQVNVRGTFLCLQAAVEKMIAHGGGSIVNLASIASKVGIPDRFAYSMTKGAVLSMTLSVARDFVAQGIRANCICPARVHTPFVDGFLAKNYPGKEEEMFAKLSAAQPIGRMGQPEEIAALVAFLCSDEAGFITGSAYDIDGGFTLLR